MAAVEALLCSLPVATEADPIFVARPEATNCRSERRHADVRVGEHEAAAARPKAARDDGAMGAVGALLLRSPPGRPRRPSCGLGVDPRLSPPPKETPPPPATHAAAGPAVAAPPSGAAIAEANRLPPMSGPVAVVLAARPSGGDLALTAAQPWQQQQSEVVDTPGRYGDAAAARDDDEGAATPAAPDDDDQRLRRIVRAVVSASRAVGDDGDDGMRPKMLPAVLSAVAAAPGDLLCDASCVSSVALRVLSAGARLPTRRHTTHRPYSTRVAGARGRMRRARAGSRSSPPRWE